MKQKTIKRINWWKVIAIVFIFLFVLESIAFVLIWSWGANSLANEEECRTNICGIFEGYYWDSYSSICSCWQNGEYVKQQYIK